MNQIRTLREEQNLSLREVAHFVGISHATLSRLERGEIDTSVETKVRVARALGVPVADVFPGGQTDA